MNLTILECKGVRLLASLTMLKSTEKRARMKTSTTKTIKILNIIVITTQYLPKWTKRLLVLNLYINTMYCSILVNFKPLRLKIDKNSAKKNKLKLQVVF